MQAVSEPSPDAAGATEPVVVEPMTDQLPDIADWLPEFAQPAWQLIDQIPLLAGLVVAIVALLVAFVARFFSAQVMRRFAAEVDLSHSAIALLLRQ